MIEDRVETVKTECPHGSELCGPAITAANSYLDTAGERLREATLKKISQSIDLEREKSLVFCAMNATITAIVLLVASTLLVSYSYHFRGYFMIGFEFIAIALIGGLMPLMLYWLEQKWMREYD